MLITFLEFALTNADNIIQTEFLIDDVVVYNLDSSDSHNSGSGSGSGDEGSAFNNNHLLDGDNGSGSESGSGSGDEGSGFNNNHLLDGDNGSGSESGSGSGDEGSGFNNNLLLDGDNGYSGSGSGTGEIVTPTIPPTTEATTTTSAASTTTIEPITGQHDAFRYVGCFADSPDDRVLPVKGGASAVMTPALCGQLCDAKGSFLFFGVQYGAECWCGNDPFRWAPVEYCDYPCAGDDNTICGGFYSSSVYAYVTIDFSKTITATLSTTTTAPSTATTANEAIDAIDAITTPDTAQLAVVPVPGNFTGLAYEGCFFDNQNDHALNGAHFFDYAMTPDRCLALCSTGGFAYIGLQYSFECYCGDTPFAYGQPSGGDFACSAPCAGEPDVACGGLLVNSVYRVLASAETDESDNDAGMRH